MNYLTEMHDAIARRQGWQFDRDMTDADPDKLAQYRANEIRADDDARLMALASIAESLARIADALETSSEASEMAIRSAIWGTKQ